MGKVNKSDVSLREVYSKYINGDEITDLEIEVCIKKLKILNEYLLDMGERFFISWKESRRFEQGLIEFKKARKC